MMKKGNSMIPVSTANSKPQTEIQTQLRRHPIVLGMFAAGVFATTSVAQAADLQISNHLVENVTKVSDTQYTFEIRVQVEDPDPIPEDRTGQEEYNYAVITDLDGAFTNPDITYVVSNLRTVPASNVTDTDGNDVVEYRGGSAGTGGNTGPLTIGTGTLADGQFARFSYDLKVTYANEATGAIGAFTAGLDQALTSDTLDGVVDKQSAPIPSLFIPSGVVTEQLTCPDDEPVGTKNLVKNGSFTTLHGFQTGDDDVPAGSLIADSFTSDAPYTGEPPAGVFKDGGIVIHQNQMLRGNGSVYLQYPFPGDPDNNIDAAGNMLSSAGILPGSGAAWIQTVDVTAGRTYNFFTYVSNPMWIGQQNTFLPTVQLVADGTPVAGAEKQLAMETVGDEWHLIHGQITATSASTTLEIRNTNQDNNSWNQLAVTGISLYKCGGSTANTVPVAEDDVATTETGQAVTIDVLSNDTTGDGANTVTIGAGQEPDTAQGTADVINSEITFTPAAGFTGDVAFGYTLSDVDGDESVARVTVTVSGGVDPAPDPTPDPTPEPDNNSGGGGGSTGLALLGLSALGLRRRFKR